MEYPTSSNHPELYQLIGPIEQLYQLVPFGWLEVDDYERPSVGLMQLIPIGPPHHLDEFDGDQYQLVGPIRGDLVVVDEELYQLAAPNELDAPIQMLAIEGPPQWQIVGPVPVLRKVRCRFANDSHRLVDLVWTDNSNRMYKYARLAHEEFIDITTFEGHQWIFLDSLDGQLYLINPGRMKKFVANNTGDGRRRLRISATSTAEDITLRRIVLRRLAKQIFEIWDCEENRAAPPIDIVMRSLRVPLFVQIQLANFVLSCILYQLKFESASLTVHRQMMLNWLVNFIRLKTEGN